MIKLKVVQVDKKTGEAICEFDYDQDFINFYKKETGAKTVRKNNVGKFIVGMLSRACENSGNISPATPISS
jgi:hypothetical protein